MAQSPAISIIMAAYNAQHCIAAAIGSVLRQTFADWELLVIDDCSTDSTPDIVRAIAVSQPRVKIARQPRNLGSASARNAALDLARGAWIAVLDSDDAYEPERLATLLDHVTRENLDLVADNLDLFDEDAGLVIGKAFVLPGESCELTQRRLVENDGPPRIASLGHLKPFFRKSLTASGLRYPAETRLGEDFCFLFLLLGAAERAQLIDYAGYRYTMPFSLASGRRASNTHTSYGSDGLNDLLRANESLMTIVAQQDSADRELLSTLKSRGDRLRDEAVWREARSYFGQRRFLRAAGLLARVDLSFAHAQWRAIRDRRKGMFQTRVV